LLGGDLRARRAAIAQRLSPPPQGQAGLVPTTVMRRNAAAQRAALAPTTPVDVRSSPDAVWGASVPAAPSVAPVSIEVPSSIEVSRGSAAPAPRGAMVDAPPGATNHAASSNTLVSAQLSPAGRAAAAKGAPAGKRALLVIALLGLAGGAIAAWRWLAPGEGEPTAGTTRAAPGAPSGGQVVAMTTATATPDPTVGVPAATSAPSPPKSAPVPSARPSTRPSTAPTGLPTGITTSNPYRPK
jgi:hypothetical protein